MKNLFNTSFGVKLDATEVAKAIVDFMAQEQNFFYKVIIGSDSLRLADNSADFVTAVVVHRVGNGGRYFWRRLEIKKFYTLRDRIINEVLMSIEVAQNVLRELKSLGAVNFDFEIHADIGENGATKSMIQEVVGMIRAYNFEVKTKPDSYAASKVADRHV
ncbi:MAG: ribonuclease H-like YkuK family protein [Candidatus Liptonbacteria bacterium]|nr:ribonuclease H-like YkuK family protein [Candidatus Liptonbacteria bacterium]